MSPSLRGGLLLVLILAVTVLPSSHPGAGGGMIGWSPKAEGKQLEGTIQDTIGKMTLEQKVGQMFMVGFHNEDRPAQEMNRQIRTLIRDHHVGGVILFDRNIGNPRQTAELNNSMQRLALSASPGIPLLISIDQEGGKVARIREGVTQFPGGMTLGASGNPDLARQSGQVAGSELRAMGFNMNMAPVLDVNNNPKNPVIGTRSFSGDPRQVVEMASAQIQGYHDGGVLTVVKHFPGHGDTSTDSHIDLPTVTHSMDRLNRVELVPFKGVLNRTDAVMSAHITFPALDDTPGLPGTLSQKVLTGLLRERLGYDGVIITDDLEMGAIVDNFPAEEAAIRAVKAGADILLISHDLNRQQASIRGIRDAVKRGEISEARIDRSLRRILHLKGKRTGVASLAEQSVTPVNQVAERVGTARNDQVARRTAEAGLTLLQDPKGLIPRAPDKQQELLVVSVAGGRELEKSLQGYGFRTQHRELDPDPSQQEISKLVEQSTAVDGVIVGTSRAEIHSGQRRLVQALSERGIPVIVLGLDTPYEVSVFPGDVTYLALYGYDSHLMKAAAGAIAGKIPIRGKLPVAIPGRYPAGHGLGR